MSVQIIGKEALQDALGGILDNLQDGELITRPLASDMQKFVHVRSGYLRSTIYFRGFEAGAEASYAGIEEERHKYATEAIENLDMEDYADKVVEPF